MPMTHVPANDRFDEALAVYDELRWRLGPGPARAEVLQAFPEVADRLRRLWRMLPPAPVPVPGFDERAPGQCRPDLPAVPGYELLGLLGQGGAGVVYKARQLRPSRIVALKLLRFGVGSGPASLARFRAEAEAAGKLHHPNLVTIFAAGPAEADSATSPYIAQEYVEGPTLAQRLKDGPLPARPAAELVELLARAIHYAHQQGIVHRDLKPGNVLLLQAQSRTAPAAASTDGEAQTPTNSVDLTSRSGHSFGIGPSSVVMPKIADFGLAKWLGAEHGLSQSGEVIGTPAYMAPEQAFAQADVGPAADVYALGVILYECLAGHPPFQNPDTNALLRRVRFEEPLPLRRKAAHVPRDLATITHHCLEKEPHRRYGSAAALADDLRRFLDGRPTLARPVGPLGQAVKWARRRPEIAALAMGLAVAAVAVVAVIVLWGVSQWRAYLREQALRQTADDQRQRADRAVREIMAQAETTGALQASLPAARALLQRTAAAIDDLARSASGDEPGRADAADLYRRMGRLRYTLGDLAGAEEAYRQSIALSEGLHAAAPDDPAHRHRLAAALREWGVTQAVQRRGQSAEEAWRRAVDLLQPLAGTDPGAQHTRAKVHLVLGNLEAQRFHPDSADAEYARAQAMAEQLVQGAPADRTYRFTLAEALNNRGWLTLSRCRPADAERLHRRAVALGRQLVQEVPDDPDQRAYLAAGLNHLGNALQPQGPEKYAEAEGCYREALTIYEALAVAFPGLASHRQELAEVFNNLSHLAAAQQRYGETVALARRAVELFTRMDREHPGRPELAAAQAVALEQLADALTKNGQHDAAGEPSYAAALAFARAAVQLAGREPPELLEPYATKAVALLARANERHYFTTPGKVQALDREPGFARFRDRTDYQQFRQTLNPKPREDANPSKGGAPANSSTKEPQ